jgi:nucleoid DNA-binding protein
MGFERARPEGIARNKGVNKEYISAQIQDFLEFPLEWGDDVRKCKAYYVTSTIIDILTEAISRGEEIDIPGFGNLKIITNPAKRAPCYYFYGEKQGNFYEVRHIPPRKKLIFTPCTSLLSFLKEPVDD